MLLHQAFIIPTAWLSLPHATLLNPPYQIVYLSWYPLSHVMLLGLDLPRAAFLTFLGYGALCSLYRVKLFGLVFRLIPCLAFPTSC